MTGRITVALLPKVSAELAATQAATGMSKTDIVNRAIRLYHLVDHRTRSGQTLAFVSSDGDLVQAVELL